jgi:hypothetical protein
MERIDGSAGQCLGLCRLNSTDNYGPLRLAVGKNAESLIRQPGSRECLEEHPALQGNTYAAMTPKPRGVERVTYQALERVTMRRVNRSAAGSNLTKLTA